MFANAITDGASAVSGAGSSIIDQVKSWLEILGPAGKYVAAILVFLVGKIIAKFVGKMVGKGLGKTGLDDRLAGIAGMNGGLEAGIGKLVYYLLLLFVVILALDTAGMADAVEPLKGMLSQFLNYIPNLIGGGVLLFLFVFLAKVVKNIVANLMGTARVDERLGITEGQPITQSVSNGLFAFILLMLIPTALAAFKLPAISEPLTGVTQQITNNIPNVLIGFVLLAAGYFIAKIVKELIYNMLTAVGFNNFPAKLGYAGQLGTGSKSPAGIVSLLSMITIMVTIATQALGIMNLGMISEMGQSFLGGYFNILGALIILGIAIFVANLVYSNLVGKNATLASIAKYAILIFAGFMALQRTGIAPDITGTPFVALITAAAIALGIGGAIAIGLGGRDAAHRVLDRYIK